MFKQNNMHYNEMESRQSDMLVEIFTKLPSKDMAICKSVCKAWYHILSHPNFTNYCTARSPFTSFLLIQNNSSLLLLESHVNGSHLTTSIKVTESDEACTVIGSCNGLIFFSQAFNNGEIEKLYCCNPLLTGCVELAKYEALPRQPSSEYHEVYYFAAYIPSSSSYKLLRILSLGFGRVEEAHVLVVGIDSGWRRLDYEQSRRLECPGVCLNGDYIWVSEHNEVRFLTAFNLGEEEFGWVLKLPEMLQKMYGIFLIVLKNCITVIDLSDFDKIGIWRMEGYGRGTSSWSRMVVIKKPSVDIPPHLIPIYAIAALPDADNFIISFFHGQTIRELDCLRIVEFTPKFCFIV